MAIENNNYGWQVMHSALGDAYTVLYKALMYDCKIPHSELERITSVLETALKVKERNCDVGMPGKQWERFDEFCEGYQESGPTGGCSSFCPCLESKCKECDGWVGRSGCFAFWAQMPYAAEEGVGK